MPQRLPPIKKATGKTTTGSLSVFPTEVTVDGKKMPPHITLQQATQYGIVRQSEVLEEKVSRAEVREGSGAWQLYVDSSVEHAARGWELVGF